MATSTLSKFDGKGGGRWTWISSDLKSLLETGKPLSAVTASERSIAAQR